MILHPQRCETCGNEKCIWNKENQHAYSGCFPKRKVTLASQWANKFMSRVGCASHSSAQTGQEIRIKDLKTEVKDLKASVEFYKLRCNYLQEIQVKMRDPERKIVCDILANGKPSKILGQAGCIEVENVTPVNGWNSTRLIGNVEERYDQVKHYGKTHSLKGEEWDWQSFYNGWIEGRLAMSAELRNGDVRLCNDCPFKPDRDCAAYLYKD